MTTNASSLLTQPSTDLLVASVKSGVPPMNQKHETKTAVQIECNENVYLVIQKAKFAQLMKNRAQFKRKNNLFCFSSMVHFLSDRRTSHNAMSKKMMT